MITRIWAVIRTIYFLVVVGYTRLGDAVDDPDGGPHLRRAVCPLRRRHLAAAEAAWLAIAWIALETLLGWIAVWRRRGAPPAPPRHLRPASPPTAPPGRLP